MNSHYERAFPVARSLRIAEETINALNLRVNDEAYGIDLQTYRCKLIDDNQQLIFYGFGKGLGLQSKASAYFEALEHYAVHLFAKIAADNPGNYIAMDAYQARLPCVDLLEIHTNKKISYPVFMMDPRYAKNKSKNDRMDYSSYAYLANDSGVASGSNMIEASIHALNELVERDSHSLFLIEAFIKNKNQKINVIDKTTLPVTLKEIVKKIEEQYNDNLMLFDITSEIGIPVMYVSMTRQPFRIQPSGCGASLKAEYALERALLETLQPVHIHNETLDENQKEISEELASYPLLLKAAIADVTTINNAHIIDFSSLMNNENLTLINQLKTIIKKIKVRGYSIYKAPIMNITDGFTCVKFLIPEFEQFHLVQTGKRILPNKRGMQLLMN